MGWVGYGVAMGWLWGGLAMWWAGYGLAMGWLQVGLAVGWAGYGLVMGWLWVGYGLVMGWLRVGLALRHPSGPAIGAAGPHPTPRPDPALPPHRSAADPRRLHAAPAGEGIWGLPV